MIYIIRMTETKYYKIGFTSGEIKDRLALLQSSNPRKLEIICTCSGNRTQEKSLHKQLSHYKTDGGKEWFELPDGIIDKLKKEKITPSFSITNIKEITANRRLFNAKEMTIYWDLTTSKLNVLIQNEKLRIVHIPGLSEVLFDRNDIDRLIEEFKRESQYKNKPVSIPRLDRVMFNQEDLDQMIEESKTKALAGE